ncbi:hypothetical protein PFISCL1PPCAC_27398, partial [Pristionchus fissidentatus]
GSGLLLEPSDDRGRVASSSVLLSLSGTEELEGGVSTDLELGSDISVNGGVELGELDVRSLLLQLSGGLGVFGSEGLAVSTPRSVELGQNELIRLNHMVEVVLNENDDVLLLLNDGIGSDEQCRRKEKSRDSKSTDHLYSLH